MESSIETTQGTRKTEDEYVAEFMADVPVLPVRPEAIEAAMAASDLSLENPMDAITSRAFDTIMYDHLTFVEREIVFRMRHEKALKEHQQKEGE